MTQMAINIAQDASEVTKKTGASSIDDLQGGGAAIAAHLKGALSLLPELKERKALLSMHMNILKALIKGIEGMSTLKSMNSRRLLSHLRPQSARVLPIGRRNLETDKGTNPRSDQGHREGQRASRQAQVLPTMVPSHRSRSRKSRSRKLHPSARSRWRRHYAHQIHQGTTFAPRCTGKETQTNK